MVIDRLATLIITIRSTGGIDTIRDEIQRIDGVSQVEFNYLSHKLRVRYYTVDSGDTQAKIRAIIAEHSKEDPNS